MIPIDKQAHFYSGLALCLAVSLFFSPVVGLLASLAAAIAKEVWDSMGNGTLDPLDFLATAIGGALGGALVMFSEVL